MNPSTAALEALKSLEGLHADLVRAERSMPTAELRQEMARLSASVKRSAGRLLSSQQVAAELLGAKRKKNADLAAKNAAAIKQARAKRQQPAAPAATQESERPPIDPALCGLLRDELLDRFASPSPEETATSIAPDILSDWHWTTTPQPPATIPSP